MEKRSTRVVVGILALAGLLGVWTLATAGDLEPNSPPGPTMKTLDEIYDAAAAGASEREGYISHIDTMPSSSTTLFVVPTGKKFVLLKMALGGWQMYLTKNGGFLTGGEYIVAMDRGIDFPDRCVVLNEGDSLGIVNPHTSELKVMIVGYFFDI